MYSKIFWIPQFLKWKVLIFLAKSFSVQNVDKCAICWRFGGYFDCWISERRQKEEVMKVVRKNEKRKQHIFHSCPESVKECVERCKWNITNVCFAKWQSYWGKGSWRLLKRCELYEFLWWCGEGASPRAPICCDLLLPSALFCLKFRANYFTPGDAYISTALHVTSWSNRRFTLSLITSITFISTQHTLFIDINKKHIAYSTHPPNIA